MPSTGLTQSGHRFLCGTFTTLTSLNLPNHLRRETSLGSSFPFCSWDN